MIVAKVTENTNDTLEESIMALPNTNLGDFGCVAVFPYDLIVEPPRPSKPKEKTRARKKRKHLNGRLSPCYLKSFSFTPPETSTPSVSVHSVHT